MASVKVVNDSFVFPTTLFILQAIYPEKPVSIKKQFM